MRALLVVASALLALPVAAQAPKDGTVIAMCGASVGSAYYFEGGIVGPGQGGWRKDGVDGGVLIFYRDAAGMDVFFTDTSGKARSHREEGSDVSLVAHDRTTNTFLITAANRASQSVEHFMLRLGPAGVGTVVWGTVSAGGMRAKSSLMTAECSKS